MPDSDTHAYKALELLEYASSIPKRDIEDKMTALVVLSKSAIHAMLEVSSAIYVLSNEVRKLREEGAEVVRR